MSWFQLLDILKQGAAYREFYATQPPVACPRCGEPLIAGPESAEVTLLCRVDGWAYPRDWSQSQTQ